MDGFAAHVLVPLEPVAVPVPDLVSAREPGGLAVPSRLRGPFQESRFSKVPLAEVDQRSTQGPW